MQSWSTLTPEQQSQLLARPAVAKADSIKQAVAEVIQQVAAQGDVALLALTAKFDGVEVSQLQLPTSQLDAAEQQIKPAVKQAIDTAYANIRRFHQAQMPQDVSIETSPGVRCDLKHSAIDSVGLYIPGGTAPLPSTVLMLGAVAQVAGCKRKVLCTPPGKDGTVPVEIRYAARLCEIDEVFTLGGAQAIAALALGTASIAKVDKIFGPGNSYVTEAKQQVSLLSGGPAIDMPAGPSEVLVIADSKANPAFVAADMLSQAEHGVDSQAILVADSSELITKVKTCVEQQLAQLSRSDITAKAMQHARYILTESLAESIAVSNQYAPEHLIVQVNNARDCLSQLGNAGSIFLGQYSPESAGDYASGTNHVLPTYGYARNYSSLGLLDFMRRYTVQELSYQGLENIGNAIMDLAAAEGLDAHKNAVAIRLEEVSNE